MVELLAAAKTYAIENSLLGYESAPYRGFIAGAEWAQKQLEQELQYFRDKEKTDEQRAKEIINSLCTEKEVLDILKQLRKDIFIKGDIDIIKWFDRNKNR